MAQVDQGLRSLLTQAKNYDFVQNLLGAEHLRKVLVRDYIRPQSGMSILDIGCGTASILAHLPEVKYVGFDMNSLYIDAARAQFGSRGTFVCGDVNAAPPEAQGGSFDRVLAIGLLHHLEDTEVRGLMTSARKLLARGGKLLTIDPCYRDGQSWFARFLIDRDRGQNPRTEAGYVALARSIFDSAQATVREDLLRVPYTHLVMSCS
jgi:SAM-dependent methyltransferase